MHPALSIILFTTLSGLGFGLLAWLGTSSASPDVRPAATIGAFVLASAGLVASTFHLGHPERAWRALSQWRSSWLSREGVMAMLTLGTVMAWWLSGFSQWLGALLALFALSTVYTTAMIYAQMRSVRQWETALTPAVFLLLALAGGGLLFLFAAATNGGAGVGSSTAVLILIVAAWTVKFAWWRRADGDIEISATRSATGLGIGGEVRLFESPHTGTNYLLREMGFRVGRKHARTLRRIAVLAGGVVPAAGVILALAFDELALFVLAPAIVVHLLGVLAERWLFFAEARHAVMSYYAGAARA